MKTNPDKNKGLPSSHQPETSRREQTEAAWRLEVALRKEAEAEREAGEERLRVLLTSAKDFAFFVMDTEGRIITWNPGAEHIFGYAEAEIIGQPFARLFTPEDVQAGVPEREMRIAAERGVADDDRWHLRKDGSRFWVNGVTTALKNDTVRAFAKLVRDLTEQKRAEEALRESEAQLRQKADQLEQKAKELAAANQHKDHFLAVLSHELRNPLAPIRTATQIICQQTSDNPIIQPACNILERQVRMLTRLVDDLLEAARITSGKIQLRQEVVELSVCVNRVVQVTRSLADARKQHLSVSLPEQPVWLRADPVRLEQVILNLLTNAVKYTGDGGTIWLSAAREGDRAVVRVRDNGIGIAPEMLPQVFGLFAQAERSLNRSEGGLGIGLAVAKSLVELHGGTVEAHSEGLGKGSEFVVRLPLLNAPPAEQVVPPAAKEASRALRILVVDDNHDAADSIAMLLRVSGHDVRTEYSGAGALEIVATYQPQVILLDIGMPGMDGLQVAERLRQQHDLRKIALVALTGYAQEGDVQRTKQAGFNYHLVKPVDPQRLRDLLGVLANG